MKKNVEFHARDKRWRSFVHNGEWGSLRGNRTAETHQDRNEPDDLGRLTESSFLRHHSPSVCNQ
jgi:hypothetical protein